MWVGLIFTVLLHFFMVFKAPKYNRFQEPYIPPPKAIQHLTAGFKVQVADSFWVRAIQDFDYCSKKLGENLCENDSWLYAVLDLASTLDPKLEPIMYQTGGLALSVLVSDIEGAAKFFEKGVRIYPNNWYISYGAAFHALYEEKNKNKAAKLYLQAFDHGAPSWTQQLASKLASEGGDTEFAEQIIMDMIAQNKDEKVINRLKSKLEEAKLKK